MIRLRGVWWAAVFLWALSVPAVRAMPGAAPIRAAFTAVDTTGNAAISLDEWDRASFALFRAADKNNNDFIDADELQGSNIAQDTFLRADIDHDGRLSVSEFMDLRRALFQLADIDRNDNLDYVEFELLIVMEQVGWTDHNQNGRIDLSELRESLAKAFEQLDTDHDGKLSAAEAAYMPVGEFKAFDKNSDGQLSLDEFIAGYRTALLGGY
jgi:Ca2+-binding EF-hand superfamily protein